MKSLLQTTKKDFPYKTLMDVKRDGKGGNIGKRESNFPLISHIFCTIKNRLFTES